MMILIFILKSWIESSSAVQCYMLSVFFFFFRRKYEFLKALLSWLCAHVGVLVLP